jgi:heme/copper-type cytochrome/quinol oxidase subunit 4
MDNIFLIAGVISIIFFIATFLEMKYVETEDKSVKILIRDSLLVYICVIVGIFIIEQLQPVINESRISNPVAFIDNPPF